VTQRADAGSRRSLNGTEPADLGRTGPWEQGSSLPLVRVENDRSAGVLARFPSVLGTSVSGRGALLAILERVVQPQSRIWLPSYFCPDVREAVRNSFANTLLALRDDPREAVFEMPTSRFAPDDVIVVQNLYGMRAEPEYDPALCQTCAIVEDHTHDPLSQWARTTDADYAFASLRKTFPVPDGGIVWSRAREELFPVVPNPQGMLEAIGDRVKAMLMKQEYLVGSGQIEKASYRAYEDSVEDAFGRLPHGTMTDVSAALLQVLPVDEWRAAHRRNFTFLAGRLRCAGFDVLEPRASEAAPFGVVVDLHDPELASHVRDGLLARDIYPSVLWEEAEEGVQGGFSKEHLVLKCDYRYDEFVLETVADVFLALAE
jgi:hypothetical protein